MKIEIKTPYPSLKIIDLVTKEEKPRIGDWLDYNLLTYTKDKLIKDYMCEKILIEQNHDFEPTNIYCAYIDNELTIIDNEKYLELKGNKPIYQITKTPIPYPNFNETTEFISFDNSFKDKGWDIYYSIDGRKPLPGTDYTYVYKKPFHLLNGIIQAIAVHDNEILGDITILTKMKIYTTNHAPYSYDLHTSNIELFEPSQYYGKKDFKLITKEEYLNTKNNITPTDFVENKAFIFVDTDNKTISYNSPQNRLNMWDSDGMWVYNSKSFDKGFMRVRYLMPTDQELAYPTYYIDTNVIRSEGEWFDLKVDFDPNSTVDNIKIKITCNNPFAKIYYSFNRLDVFEYIEPILITEETNVYAVAIHGDKQQTFYNIFKTSDFPKWKLDNTRIPMAYGFNSSAGEFSNALTWATGVVNLNGLDVSGASGVYAVGKGKFANSTITHITINDWDLTNTDSIYQLFYYMPYVEKIDVTNLNVRHIKTFISLCQNDRKLKEIDLSTWENDSCTRLEYMFANCSSLSSLDLSGFDTTNVESVDGMFTGCTRLRFIKLSTNFFNTPLMLDFSGAQYLGFGGDGLTNGWIEMLSEILPDLSLRASDSSDIQTRFGWAPELGGEPGDIGPDPSETRSIKLHSNIKNASWSAPYIQIINNKGYTII